MSAIITDQLRITLARRFVKSISSGEDNYYTFIGLPNSSDYQSDWDSNPPAPKDSFDQESDYWDTMIALKKVTPTNVKQIVKKNVWQSGTTYDMYRHDISRTNTSKPSNATSLYSSNYFIVNQDYKVYICLQNGSDPENPKGRPSLDEPIFTDLEPRRAGDSGDGYIWKYLYTVKPSDIIKFDSTNYIPVPNDWETNLEYSSIRNHSLSSGQIKIVTIVNRGVAVGPANRTYTKVPIRGNGSGAEATIIVNNDSKIESITITNGGSGYTYGTVDLIRGGVPTGSISPVFNVIIPPKNGHGYDIYRELGATKVMIYSRFENDPLNPDFIVGNQTARIGVIKNPESYGSSTLLTADKASALSAIKVSGNNLNSTIFQADSYFTQTVGLGATAIGRVAEFNSSTNVLKYWQDRSMAGFTTTGVQISNPQFGFNLNKFTSSPSNGGSLILKSGANNIIIDTSFNGSFITINNNYLGQSFTNGLSNPEVKKYSGDIVHVDNRPSFTRSVNQKEDIKVILQF
jgi:Bacteriophage T4, Gp8